MLIGSPQASNQPCTCRIPHGILLDGRKLISALKKNGNYIRLSTIIFAVCQRTVLGSTFSSSFTLDPGQAVPFIKLFIVHRISLSTAACCHMLHVRNGGITSASVGNSFRMHRASEYLFDVVSLPRMLCTFFVIRFEHRWKLYRKDAN